VNKNVNKEGSMAKVDLDALSIEELASLRDRAIEKLAEKVAARQAELEAELERLSLYGAKPAKKVQAAPVAPRAKKQERSAEAEQAKPDGEEAVSEAA
jgi:DNA-binding protein H-NS